MKFAACNSYDIAAQITKTTPVILPIGAVEAHGPHLPLETDNILAEKYADRIADKKKRPSVTCLTIWTSFQFAGLPGQSEFVE